VNGLVSWPIAKATARERAIAPFTLLCLAAIFLLGWIRNTADTFGAEAFSNVSSIWFFLLMLSLGGGLLSSEVESGHAQLVLLRPITRAQWVSGRLLGAGLVLCFGGVLRWATNLVAAVVFRGGASEIPARLLVLPLGLLPALGWLATATALSAFVRGWSNSGILLGACAAWVATHYGAPVVFPRLELKPLLDALDPYMGPQKLLEIVDQARSGGPVVFSPVLWDVFWFLAAWTAAVWLFNQRELARRRG
jgi:hypothetical protein